MKYHLRTGIFFALAAAVLLGACVGTKALGVLDDSIPEEQLSHLQINNSLTVILFDNKPVEWAPGLFDNRVTISLPPGQHSFLVKWYETTGSGAMQRTVTRTAEVPTTEFLSGHTYRIYKQNIWLLIVTITSVKIKDITPKTK
jgi:hypothetical protein